MKTLLPVFALSCLAACVAPKTAYRTVKGVVIENDSAQHNKKFVQELSPEFRKQLHDQNDTILQVVVGTRPDPTVIFPGFSKKEAAHTSAILAEKTQNTDHMYLYTKNGAMTKKGNLYKKDPADKFSQDGLLYKREENSRGLTVEIARSGGSYMRQWKVEEPDFHRGHKRMAEPFVW